MRSVCLIARASHKEYRNQLPEDHFRWILQGESLGYLLGPLLVAIMSTYMKEQSSDIFLMLALATTSVWLFFTICFHEDEPIKASAFQTTFPSASRSASKSKEREREGENESMIKEHEIDEANQNRRKELGAEEAQNLEGASVSVVQKQKDSKNKHRGFIKSILYN